MYDLFASEFDGNLPVVKPAGFELIRRTYQREIASIVNYYNGRVFAVRGNHLLCRLLTTGMVSTEYDISRFMEIVYARSPYVAKNFRLTSAIEYGVFHDGVLYGPGNKELIFYHEDYFNPFDAVENWKTLKPIKVLSHQISDFGLMLADGHINSDGQGFCAVAINLPMLLCMYRGFLLDQSARFNDRGDSKGVLGVTHFVHMYVLPSMLYSHIDVVIMNRLHNLYKEQPMSRPMRKHAFAVVDYGSRVDDVLMEVIGRLEDSSRSYYGYLQNIPSIFHEDMQKSLVMPDIARTRQAWWALNLSRLEIMGLLLNLGGVNGVRSNGVLINKFKRTCKYLVRENMLDMLVPASLSLDIESAIQDVMAL